MTGYLNIYEPMWEREMGPRLEWMCAYHTSHMCEEEKYTAKIFVYIFSKLVFSLIDLIYFNQFNFWFYAFRIEF